MWLWRGKADTSEVESAGKGAATAWNWTDKVSLVAPATCAGELSCGGGDLLLLDLEYGGQTGHALGRGIVVCTGGVVAVVVCEAVCLRVELCGRGGVYEV